MPKLILRIVAYTFSNVCGKTSPVSVRCSQKKKWFLFSASQCTVALLHISMIEFVWLCSVAVCDKSQQVPCVWVSRPVSRASRWQNHRLLWQRLCTQELRSEAAEVRAFLKNVWHGFDLRRQYRQDCLGGLQCLLSNWLAAWLVAFG